MPRAKTKSFQTETKQLMQLMLHSLYSNKEIFLRVLVSNASVALDNFRFKPICKAKLLACLLNISIYLNKENESSAASAVWFQFEMIWFLLLA